MPGVRAGPAGGLRPRPSCSARAPLRWGSNALRCHCSFQARGPRHVLGDSRRRLLTSWHGVAVRVGYHFLVQGLVLVPNQDLLRSVVKCRGLQGKEVCFE